MWTNETTFTIRTVIIVYSTFSTQVYMYLYMYTNMYTYNTCICMYMYTKNMMNIFSNFDEKNVASVKLKKLKAARHATTNGRKQ